MEAQQSHHYQIHHYTLQLTPIGSQNISLRVLDANQGVQYAAQDIPLKQIQTNTVTIALAQTHPDITAIFHPKEDCGLEIVVSVQSPFLKTLHESIHLPKQREVGVLEIARSAVNRLTSRVKQLTSPNNKKGRCSYFGAKFEAKHYSGQNYEPIAAITLPKGRYMLTLSFLLKCQNQWIYLYLGQGGQLMVNGGFYMPQSSVWTPYTIRKQHDVTADKQEVSFTTYCAGSYPVTVQNVIIVARMLE